MTRAYPFAADLLRSAADTTAASIVSECSSYHSQTTTTLLGRISVSDNLDQVLDKIQSLQTPHDVLVTGNFYAVGILKTLIEQDVGRAAVDPNAHPTSRSESHSRLSC